MHKPLEEVRDESMVYDRDYDHDDDGEPVVGAEAVKVFAVLFAPALLAVVASGVLVLWGEPIAEWLRGMLA